MGVSTAPAKLLTGSPIIARAFRFLDALAQPQPLAYLLAAAGLSGMAFCFLLFSPSFLDGTSPYWNNPRGLVGNSWADISAALSGYYYFLHGSWHLPLFQVSALGGGTNVIFTDSIPAVLVVGRLWYELTGSTANLYGVWTAFCFVASAVSMTWLIAELGERSTAAAAASVVTALCMPALLYRWGHMSLMAQFEVVLALIFAVRSKRSCRPFPCLLLATSLCWLSLWTQAYIFAMVFGIVFAAIAQAAVDRTLRPTTALAIGLTVCVIISAVIWLSGYFSGAKSFQADGFGDYSLNLLSPVIRAPNSILLGPQRQYEGYGYLGAGLLLLVVLERRAVWNKLIRSYKRYPCLLFVLTAFVLFALSDRVYVGPLPVLTIPLPTPLLHFAEMFRSSGRFFWPAMYGLAATLIVAAGRRRDRNSSALLLVVCALQIMDTTPLCASLAAVTSAPAPTQFDAALWTRTISRYGYLEVVPAFGCSGRRQSLQDALQLELLAAKADVPTNTVYAARSVPKCSSPPQAAASSPGRSTLIVRMPQTSRRTTAEPVCEATAGLKTCAESSGPIPMSGNAAGRGSNIGSGAVEKVVQ